MTRSAEWQADRANFLKLIQDQDLEADVPVALRFDIPPAQAAVMAPGVTDYEDLRIACATWVQNFLAPEVDRMQQHLAWKAGADVIIPDRGSTPESCPPHEPSPWSGTSPGWPGLFRRSYPATPRAIAATPDLLPDLKGKPSHACIWCR